VVLSRPLFITNEPGRQEPFARLGARLMVGIYWRVTACGEL